MKIFIAGDSFAADWSLKHPSFKGWPNMLADKFQVKNVAQAGCSEYRILQQLSSSTLSDFDLIIVSHTSPYRIYTEYNPARSQDLLHHHCDLLYSDVKYLAKHYKEYRSVLVYFEKFFSLDYANFCYNAVREKIDTLLEDYKTIQITHTEGVECVDLNFSEEFKLNPGIINHYNVIGNKNVFEALVKKINLI